jgi:hypothetical protein
MPSALSCATVICSEARYFLIGFVRESWAAGHHRRHAALINHLDVEIGELFGGALHTLDRLFDVGIGQLRDGSETQ